MRKIIISKLALLLFVCLSSTSFSQIIINYQTWTCASGCNIFASATNVAATNNGTATSIAHLTSIGQPTYDNVNQSVNIVSETVKPLFHPLFQFTKLFLYERLQLSKPLQQCLLP